MKRINVASPLVELLLLSVGVCVVFGAGVYIWDSIARAQVAHITLRAELGQAEAYVDQLAQVRAAATSVAQERALLDQQFITQNDVVRLLEQLEQLGRSVGSDVSIKTVERTTMTPSADGTPVEGVRVEVAVRGGWQVVAATLVGIETIPIHRSIREFRARAEPDSSIWNAVVVLFFPLRQ